MDSVVTSLSFGTYTLNFLAGEAPYSALSLFGLGMAATTTHWLWVDPSLASWTPHHSAGMDPHVENESLNQHSSGAMAMRGSLPWEDEAWSKDYQSKWPTWKGGRHKPSGCGESGGVGWTSLFELLSQAGLKPMPQLFQFMKKYSPIFT